ncbi:mitochondrial 37S ribosomal protein mS47 [Lipomyces oligophaga]|uniref:mitochondrial 37S ribosomal protein mS47 n=1 Tax=Lipomyces oligophaga TaxID=45792 RepID=UPI0034CD55F6
MTLLTTSQTALLSGLSRSSRISMPLRARILNPEFFARVRMASTSAAEQKGNVDDDDVHFNVHDRTRTITLNRPRKLNALNQSMIDKMIGRLQVWKDSEDPNLVLLKGAGGKAFCAGGDVAALLSVEPKLAGKFFGEEYYLNGLIATYPKTIVALIDGITMGGGCGLAMHAPFRIATEKTVFAMPETLIGFYPDVGAGFFLSRLDGQLGAYLAITGERLNGFDAYIAGAATHFVPSYSLEEVESRLTDLATPSELLTTEVDKQGLAKFNTLINQAINDYQAVIEPGYSYSYGGDVGETIDRCFAFDTVTEIETALKAEAEAGNEFASKTLEIMALRSPLSMRIGLQAVRYGAKVSLVEMLKRDVHVAYQSVKNEEFRIGVTYRVVEKQTGRAAWSEPAKTDVEVKEQYFLSALDPEMDEFYAPIDGLEGDYNEYPYHNGLPTTTEVRDYVLGESAESGPYLMTRAEIVDYFVEKYRNKIGVEYKVSELLARKTKVVSKEEELVNWI